MKISSDLIETNSSNSSRTLVLFTTPSAEDVAYYERRKGVLARPGATFVLPDCDLTSFHPDVFALAVLVTIGPFTAREIILDSPVSDQFAALVAKHLKLEIGPVDPRIVPRKQPKDGVDGVAFSGGIDSSAALALLPPTAIAFFLNRIRPRDAAAGLYRADAALNTCEAIRRDGHDVRLCSTSLEYIRNPVGFPVDWSNATPAILQADSANLRSISFGMIAESAFFLGHSHFSELSARAIYHSWAPLFEVCGLPISLPTAGLSEVATSRIVAAWVPHWNAQSCVRGNVGQPCMKCFKCFRKAILEASLTGKVLPPSHFAVAETSAEVRRRLSTEMPIHHENVLAYAIHRLKPSGHAVQSALERLTAPISAYGDELTLLEHFYPPAEAYIAECHRDLVLSRISSIAPAMSDAEIEIVRNWELKHIVEGAEYKSAHNELKTLIAPL